MRLLTDSRETINLHGIIRDDPSKSKAIDEFTASFPTGRFDLQTF